MNREHQLSVRRQNAPGATTDLRSVLRSVAERYPHGLRESHLADIDRIAFQIDRIRMPGSAIVDLCGGTGFFAAACAALGMQSHLVDDFNDPVNKAHPIDGLAVLRELEVKIIASPARTWAREFPDDSFDVVTCFDALEHWHHSPREPFSEALRVLKPGGRVFFSAPNAVNLRKRLTVPLGFSNWSRFDDWFYPDRFRGHVREPILSDLLRLVDEIGFVRPVVWGRNWSGYCGSGDRRWLTGVIDPFLRLRPSLCANLYVLAAKPG